MAAALLVVALAATVGLGLVLYLLVDQEAENRQTMDRSRAERVARRDREEGDRGRR